MKCCMRLTTGRRSCALMVSSSRAFGKARRKFRCDIVLRRRGARMEPLSPQKTGMLSATEIERRLWGAAGHRRPHDQTGILRRSGCHAPKREEVAGSNAHCQWRRRPRFPPSNRSRYPPRCRVASNSTAGARLYSCGPLLKHDGLACGGPLVPTLKTRRSVQSRICRRSTRCACCKAAIRHIGVLDAAQAPFATALATTTPCACQSVSASLG